MADERRRVMDNEVCLITGSTDGIGEETALAIAERGATVVIHGRSRNKAEHVVKRIKEETANTSVEYFLADLASLDSVRDLVERFRVKYDRLDILINNAGTNFLRRKVTDAGFEKTFAANHLGHFLLTNLLLDLIKESAPARIINVSSNSHLQVDEYVDDWNTKSGYWVMKAYGRSKLANVLFTYELACRLEGTGITVNALHPGFVRTNIFKRIPILGPLLDPVVGLFALSPEEGARTSIHLATSPEVEGVTGKYFYKSKPVRSSPLSYDQELAKDLWNKSEHWVKLDR